MVIPGVWATNQEMGEKQHPNVIIILADDIGYGDLSCNGEPTIHTPNVEKLANGGIRFTDAHAVAATSTPSRYSLLTGHCAWRRKVRKMSMFPVSPIPVLQGRVVWDPVEMPFWNSTGV
jgi:arylsulfatase A-like enzyme